MNVDIVIDEETRARSLVVDAYDRLNRRQFISKLAELKDVHVTKKAPFFKRCNFCSFEYRGESFSISEDDWDYSFVITPKSYNQITFEALESYFRAISAHKPKTRPAFWFAGIVLIGLALYVYWQNS